MLSNIMYILRNYTLEDPGYYNTNIVAIHLSCRILSRNVKKNATYSYVYITFFVCLYQIIFFYHIYFYIYLDGLRTSHALFIVTFSGAKQSSYFETSSYFLSMNQMNQIKCIQSEFLMLPSPWEQVSCQMFSIFIFIFYNLAPACCDVLLCKAAQNE